MHEITNLKNIVSNAEVYNEELEVSLSHKLACSKTFMEHCLVYVDYTLICYGQSRLTGFWLVLPAINLPVINLVTVIM